MNIQIKNQASEIPVNWSWPVEIGFLAGLIEPDTLVQFNKRPSLKKWAHGYKISRVRPTSNILVLNKSIEDINDSLDRNTYKIKADLLVLFLEPGNELSKELVFLIKRLQNLSYNSFFIAQTPKGQSYLSWLDELVAQLSHNITVQEAMKNVGWPGNLVISKEIKEKSKVSNVFDDILNKIAKSDAADLDYNAKNVLTKGIRGKVNKHSKYRSKSIVKKSAEIIADMQIKKESFEYGSDAVASAILKEIKTKDSAYESSMKSNFGKTSEEKEKMKESGNRYLQCLFLDDEKAPAHHALVINKSYTLNIIIAVPKEGYMQAGIVSDDDVEVKIGKEERVDILLRYNGKLEQKFILLPHKGSSTEAIYDINIAEEGETHFEIFAFHKNRLFQQVDISTFLCKSADEIGDESKMKIVQINMQRTTLSDFELKEQYGMSIVFTDGYPVIAKEAGIQEIRKEEQINEFNKELADVINSYVSTKNPNHENLIYTMAVKGSILFSNLFKGIDVFDQPIQIISSDSTHFPLEFLYTHELHRKAKKLCPNAAIALEQGTCAGCNEGDEKYICPFGFLGLRTTIERHCVGENVDQISKDAIGLKTDVSMHRPAIPILTNIVFGTSEQVDKSKAGLRKQISKKITACSKDAVEANNWDNWYDAVESKQPDSLIIIGHVEADTISGANQLEIGSDLLIQSAIHKDFSLGPESKAKPFIILIGCSTQDFKISFLDLASHLKQNASIVLSVFTKIRGIQAVPLVEELLEILQSKKGEEVRFGDTMLDLRRKLFAKGNYVSMALVAHGDADWKLKI